MKTRISLLVVLIAVAAAAYIAVKTLPGLSLTIFPASGTPATSNASSTPETTEPVPPPTTAQTTIKNDAWGVFEQYVADAKAHNLPGIKSLSYQLSAACQDPKKLSDCQTLMDSVVYFGGFITKYQLTHTWFDSKQIILSSDYRETTEGKGVGYQRSIAYFTRSGNKIKLLSFNPADGVILPDVTGMSESSIDAKLASLTKDSDQDGLPDLVEDCSATGIVQTCTHTDPHKRDTNANGWWDGIEVLFYK